MLFLASLVVSSLGFLAFYYGKGTHRFSLMLLGMAGMIYPYFVESLWLMLAIFVALLGLAWLALLRDW